MRRNVPIVYIIENNGCYGLTKGQFSPTADLGSKLKNGVVNDLPPIDSARWRSSSARRFVARSFSGDKKQLLAILKAALATAARRDRRHLAVRHLQRPRGSTKSYAYVKEHDEPLGEISFVPFFEDITVDYEPGHHDRGQDARRLAAVLKKLDDDYNPTDKMRALQRAARDGAPRRVRDRRHLRRARQGRLPHPLNLVDEPLATLPLERTRPPKAVLDEIMESLR